MIILIGKEDGKKIRIKEGMRNGEKKFLKIKIELDLKEMRESGERMVGVEGKILKEIEMGKCKRNKEICKIYNGNIINIG